MDKQATTREIKLETIRRSVVECSKASLPAIKEKLLGECGRWWGTCRQNAQSLIKELESQEAIVCNGEECWSYEQWEKIKVAREKDYLKMQDIIYGNYQQELSR